MSNPNLASLTSFKLENFGGSIGSSAYATIVSNAASSGEVLEVYSALFANIDGSVSVDVTLEHLSASGVVEICSGIPVAAKTSQTVIEKNFPIIVGEGECLRRKASVGGDAAIIGSLRRYSAS